MSCRSSEVFCGWNAPEIQTHVISPEPASDSLTKEGFVVKHCGPHVDAYDGYPEVQESVTRECSKSHWPDYLRAATIGGHVVKVVQAMAASA